MLSVFMEYRKYEHEWAGRQLIVEIGKMANQANGSALITYGQTVVLATCVASKDVKKVDYLPLSVQYEEKLYAAGKIKSSRFMKREGMTTEEAVLTGRMIDRTIRPCLNQLIRNDIQVVLTVLSFDKENDPDIPAMIGASLALGLAGFDWAGPIGGVRIARRLVSEGEEKWVLNPTYDIREKSDFDLVIAGLEDKVNMLEGGAHEIKEEILVSAIEYVLPQIKSIIDFQKKIIQENQSKTLKLNHKEIQPELKKKAIEWLGDKLEKAIYQPDKETYQKEMDGLKEELISALLDEKDLSYEDKKEQLEYIYDQQTDEIVHKNILASDKRPDNRKLDQVRPIKAEVGILPRTHGSALFQRGETQALSTVTLGAPGENQLFDNMELEESKHFIHHYYFPPYCTGETGRIGGPGRREIGHGALAERALSMIAPNKESFPYTIRAVSEILSSNGSSSMASICGSSLALMDAGAPIKRHLSGVAMGLILDPDREGYKILTDIQGPEDHHGDMDCKVAGTEKGVTAVQMDVKIDGVTLDILKNTFEQAKKGRLDILAKMQEAISEPRKELSIWAPRVMTLKINPDKIKNVIGPGGKMINEIVDQTGAKIDIEDDGLVNISSNDEEGAEKALEWVKNLTREVKPGEVFQGKVVKIADFGAFVEILPGQEGLVHISEMADHHVDKVEDILKTGQMVPVKVKQIDEQGRIKLTMRCEAKKEDKNK